MKYYSYIFLDMDGTLTDTGIGVTNAAAHALEHFGIHPESRQELYRFIGPPLMDSFQRFYGFTREQAKEGVTYYREYYADTGIWEYYVYPGMEDFLKAMKADGRKVVLATSKPEEFARKILDRSGLTDLFYCITGAAMDESKLSNKTMVIQEALRRCGNPPEEQVLMVGDRFHDIEGAKNCGLDSLGVTFGFGDRAEHEAAGADYIVDSAAGLTELILSGKAEA